MNTTKSRLNKSLKQYPFDEVRKEIKAITFDVDGVIIPTGTFLREDVTGTKLIIKTQKLKPETAEMIIRIKKYIWVNFSSGRSLLYLQNMLGDILWNNVSLTAENGNFILMNGKVRQIASYNQRYFQKITNIREDLKKLKLRKPMELFGFEPKHVIITIHTAKKVPEIEKIVKKRDPEKELYCLWTNEGYDIGHKKINKMTGLEFLCRVLKIKPFEMITTGNNINDKEMLNFGVGITVDPKKVSGKYAVSKKPGVLGGEIILKYLLSAYESV